VTSTPASLWVPRTKSIVARVSPGVGRSAVPAMPGLFESGASLPRADVLGYSSRRPCGTPFCSGAHLNIVEPASRISLGSMGKSAEGGRLKVAQHEVLGRLERRAVPQGRLNRAVRSFFARIATAGSLSFSAG
jgi:hypothetical protein